MSNLIRFISVRHLTAQPLRTLLVLGAIALGVATLTAVLLINASAREAFHENIDRVSGRAALQVLGPETGFPEELRTIVQGVPGVQHAVPLVLATGFIADSGEAVRVFGLDVLDEGTVRTYRSGGGALVEDPILFLNQPNSVLLGTELAQRAGFGIESPLRLATAHGVQTLVVRGLLKSEGPVLAFGGNFAAMDLYAAQLAFGKKGLVDQIDVVLAPGVSPDEIAGRIAAQLPAALRVERPEMRKAAVDRVLAAFETMMVGFASLALLVAAFVVYNTVAMAVGQRQREMGVLRQIGVRRREILGLVTLEGALLGLIGAVVGLALGVLGANLFRGSITQAIATGFALSFSVEHLTFPAATLGSVLVAGTMAAVIASLVPALRAARMSPLLAAGRVLAAVRTAPSSRTFVVGATLLALFPASVLLLRLAPGSSAVVTAALALGNLSFFVGISIIAPLLIVALGPAARVVLRRLFGAGGYFAGEGFAGAPWRTAATLVVLMIALSFMVIAGTLARSFERSMAAWFDEAVPGTVLTVRSARSLGGWSIAPLADDLFSPLHEVPGVRYVLGKRLVNMSLMGSRIILNAIDLVPDCTDCGQHALRVPYRAGNPEHASRQLAAGEGLAISDAFALRTGLGLGDPLEIATPRGPLRLPVVGIVADYASNEGTVWMSRPLYVAHWGDRLVNYIQLFLQPGATVDQVRTEVAARFGRSHDVVLLTGKAQKDEFVTLIHDSFQFSYGLEILALGVALLGIVQILLVGALERVREIAVLRAIGMTRSQLRQSVLLEAAMIGIGGTVAGLAAGTVLASTWVNVYFPRLLGWLLDFHFPFEVAVQAAVSAVLVALLAGLYPARRVAAIPLTESMRYE